MIAREVFRFQVAASRHLNARGCPDPVYYSVFFRGCTCSFRVQRWMHIEDDVSHVVGIEDICYTRVEHRFVDVASNNDLVPLFDPFSKFHCQVFLKRQAYIPIIFDSLEIAPLLLMDRCRTSALAWLIYTHYPQNHSMPASVTCPCPSA